MRLRLAVLLSAAFVPAPSSGGEAASPSLPLQSFEYLGCSGEPSEETTDPRVWRLTSRGKVSFLVQSSASCGLEGRNPKAEVVDGVLNLEYELYSPDDVAILCLCEYWARFTFDEKALGVRNVTFDGEAVIRRGEWPK